MLYNDVIDIVNSYVRRWKHEDDIDYELKVDTDQLTYNGVFDVDSSIVFTLNPYYDYIANKAEVVFTLYKQCVGDNVLQFKVESTFSNDNTGDVVYSKTDFFDVNYYNEIDDDYRNQYKNQDAYVKAMLIEYLNKIHDFVYTCSQFDNNTSKDEIVNKLSQVYSGSWK